MFIAKWIQTSILVWDFITKISLWFQLALYLCSHELRGNETHNGMVWYGMVWISYWSFWLKWNLKPAWHFRVNKIYLKWNEYVQTHWLLCLMCMCIWNSSLWVWISYWSFWQKWNFISGIKYHAMKCLNICVHQNIVLVEMQPKLNMWTELVFTLVQNLKLLWVHFTSHVDVL